MPRRTRAPAFPPRNGARGRAGGRTLFVDFVREDNEARGLRRRVPGGRADAGSSARLGLHDAS
jgi:hypothetical protein